MARAASWTYLILFLSLSLSASPLWGADVVMRMDIPGGSMENIPVLDQRAENCFAYAAVEMFDAYRFSHGVKPDPSALSSPIEASIGTILKSGALQLQSRSVYALRYLQENGSCSAKALSEKLSPEAAKHFLEELPAFLADYKKVGDTLAAQAEARQGGAPARTGEHLTDSFKKTISCFEKDGIPPAIFPPLSVAYFALKADPVASYLRDLLARLCSTRIKEASVKLPTPQAVYIPYAYPAREKSFSKLLGILLARPDRQPVSLSFCAEALNQGRAFVPVDYDAPSVNDPKNDRCRKHTVLVIGKRTELIGKTAKTQYLLRNSWGANCEALKKGGNYSNDWQCDRDSLWVDSDTLLKSTNEVGYLDEKNYGETLFD